MKLKSWNCNDSPTTLYINRRHSLIVDFDHSKRRFADELLPDSSAVPIEINEMLIQNHRNNKNKSKENILKKKKEKIESLP